LMGEASSLGAVSIVNAVACGKGASVAVRLPTRAKVEVSERRGGWHAAMDGRPVRPALAAQSARTAIRLLGHDPGRYSGSVQTSSSIPTGVGLKTSSSASVAIILAVLSAFGEKTYRDLDILRCSASSSLAAGVSVTGAIDDAASCLRGGVNFADNSTGRVMAPSRLGRSLPVLIKVPQGRSQRASVTSRYVRRFRSVAESIFSTGRRGGIWKAMTLNGLLYSSIYGYPPLPAIQALEAGALGAGLSGTGPAVAAVFDNKRNLEALAGDWREPGARLIRTETTDGGATIGL
jgi:shikimate kinase